MSGRVIELKKINKMYDGKQALNNLDLYIKKNEFLTLLGPSGCGKTTTLRVIGGFEQPCSGEVIFEGECINSLPPNLRQLNTVFQKYALFPHLNVYENIAFGLRIKKFPENVIKTKVSKILELVNLNGFEGRTINSLSGGQQQRIAIARALVNEPRVLLLDEPLGALDLKLRKEMQAELKNMQKELGITFVYVTHDQEEALSMSDTIVVMNDGLIQQIGTPVDIYNEPKNPFVAGFIGESNILEGVVQENSLVRFADCDFRHVDTGYNPGEIVDVVIRPEDISIVDTLNGSINGVVTSVIFKGVHYEMLVKSKDYSWKIHSTDQFSSGTKVGLKVDPEDIHLMKKVGS